MDNSKDYQEIHKILPDLNMMTTEDNFEKTIIFTNTINSTQIICWDLRKLGYFTGIPWVHFFITVTVSTNTLILLGMGINPYKTYMVLYNTAVPLAPITKREVTV